MVCDKSDGDRHGSVADRDTGFPHRMDLHWLAAGCARGDIAVIETDQREIQRSSDTDAETLSAQITPVIHYVEKGINAPAPENSGQPPVIHLPESIPDIGEVIAAEGDQNDSGDGKGDEKETEEPFKPWTVLSVS